MSNMRYVGYTAMLVTRTKAPVSETRPLVAPAYRLGRLNIPTRMKSGTYRKFEVMVQNVGAEAWPADGKLHPGIFVNLAYRWFDRNNQVIMEGDRAPFPEPIHPNDLVTIALVVKTPRLPGKYRLAIAPVQEGVCWFNSPDDITVEIY